MASPVCPEGYTCTFKPPKAPYDGPWWETTWGIVIAGLVIVALAIVLLTIVNLRHQRQEVEGSRLERQREREHEETLAEQTTMQVDMAKGNPEMIRFLDDKRREDYRRR